MLVHSDSGALIPGLRVALFTDSFHEANGVATLSREFAAFAQRQQIPFLCAHSGEKTGVTHQQSVTTMDLKRGPASFRLDHDLYCDPLITRYRRWTMAQLRAFQPDLVHITGPGDVGILGAWVAHTLRIPLVASWHTNLHEYSARRLEKLFAKLPDGWRKRVCSTAETQSLRACMRFYRVARVLLAPNQGMVDLLQERTGKPAFLMEHGVDPERFSPARRTRHGGPFRIGYVGRLTPEKNVRLFADLERSLRAAGRQDFELVLIGEGSEKEWLRRHLPSSETPGNLRGAALAEAFANMDAFVFPSQTDTFGLVLLEAMASGVPVLVSPETGARVGIGHGVNGFHAAGLEAFTRSLLLLIESDSLHQEMRGAARRLATTRSWSSVFEQLYHTYEMGLAKTAVAARRPETAHPMKGSRAATSSNP